MMTLHRNFETVSSCRNLEMTGSKTRNRPREAAANVMILGVGSFAHSAAAILKENGANVLTYLTRDYGHYGATTVSRCFHWREHPSPLPLIRKHKIDLVLPMSIDWSEKTWADELANSGVPFFCPTGEALKLEKRARSRSPTLPGKQNSLSPLLLGQDAKGSGSDPETRFAPLRD